MSYVKNLRKLVGHQPLILPGSLVIIVNENKEILLQHRRDGTWGLPGGIMELGESLEETARREVKEETGLDVGHLELLDIFSGRDFYLKVENGDELYSVTAVYVTDDYKGDLEVDYTESLDMQYFPINHLPENLNDGTVRYLEPYIKRVK